MTERHGMSLVTYRDGATWQRLISGATPNATQQDPLASLMTRATQPLFRLDTRRALTTC